MKIEHILIGAGLGYFVYKGLDTLSKQESSSRNSSQMPLGIGGGVENRPANEAEYKFITDPTEVLNAEEQRNNQIIKQSYALGGKGKGVLKVPVSQSSGGRNYRATITPVIEEYQGGGGAIVATPRTKTTISEGVLNLMKRRGIV